MTILLTGNDNYDYHDLDVETVQFLSPNDSLMIIICNAI